MGVQLFGIWSPGGGLHSAIKHLRSKLNKYEHSFCVLVEWLWGANMILRKQRLRDFHRVRWSQSAVAVTPQGTVTHLGLWPHTKWPWTDLNEFLNLFFCLMISTLRLSLNQALPSVTGLPSLLPLLFFQMHYKLEKYTASLPDFYKEHTRFSERILSPK